MVVSGRTAGIVSSQSAGPQRQPQSRFCGSRYSNEVDLEKVDFRNNVIYNWGSNNIYAAKGQLQHRQQLFQARTASDKGSQKRILNPYADDGKNQQPAGVYGHFYVTGNYLHGNLSVTNENRLGVEMDGTLTSLHRQQR